MYQKNIIFFSEWHFLVSDNLLHLLEKLRKLFTRIDDKIREQKVQYDINKEAAKISVLSRNAINKYKYLTGKEILPSKIKVDW